MRYCAIAPINHLEKVAHLRSHMVLAHLWWRDSSYRIFYREKRRRGDFVILDNGAYEGSRMEPDALAEVAADLQPSVVVLPDEPNSFRENERLFWRTLGMFTPRYSCMKVIHGETLEEFYASVASALAADANLWVGLSRLTPTYNLPREQPILRRLQFLQSASWRFAALRYHRIHLLGWLGSLRELEAAATTESEVGELISSIDTVAPIWRGMHGFGLETAGWPDPAFDPFTKKTWVAQCDINLRRFEEYAANCRTGSNSQR